jgi:hypothetical protein
LDNVIYANIPTTLDIAPERILENAKDAKLETCLVLGWTKEGYLYPASSTGSVADINYLIDMAKGYFLNYDSEHS